MRTHPRANPLVKVLPILKVLEKRGHLRLPAVWTFLQQLLCTRRMRGARAPVTTSLARHSG